MLYNVLEVIRIDSVEDVEEVCPVDVSMAFNLIQEVDVDLRITHHLIL